MDEEDIISPFIIDCEVPRDPVYTDWTGPFGWELEKKVWCTWWNDSEYGWGWKIGYIIPEGGDA